MLNPVMGTVPGARACNWSPIRGSHQGQRQNTVSTDLGLGEPTGLRAARNAAVTAQTETAVRSWLMTANEFASDDIASCMSVMSRENAEAKLP